MTAGVPHVRLPLSTRERWLVLALGCALALAIFAPFVLTRAPQRIFYGDNAILYFPQFVNGFYLAQKGLLTGIDFLTNNGASAYFLRPNLPSLYPPYQLAYLLPLEGTTALARAYVFVWLAHAVAAFFFSVYLARRHFAVGRWPAILLGLLYVAGISRFAYMLPVFFYPAALFPWLLHNALESAEEPLAWWRVALRSVPVALVFLSGYPPIAMNTVAVGFLFAGFVLWAPRPETDTTFRTRLLRLAAPFLLAAALVLPMYLAIVLYHTLVPGIPSGVWQAAHERAYGSLDLASMVSSAFLDKRPDGEWPHMFVGFVSLLLLAFAYARRRELQLSPLHSRLAAGAGGLFVVYLLLSFGSVTGLPDIFYHVAPGLGKMHYYGRYLIVGSFFLFLLVALLLDPVVRERANLPIGKMVLGLIALMLAIHLLTEFFPTRPGLKFNRNQLVVELLMVVIALLSLATRQAAHAYAGVVGISFLLAFAPTQFPMNNFGSTEPAPYLEHLSNSPEREARVRAYFKEYAAPGKTLVKYVDLTPSVEKLKGIGSNYPWIAQGEQMLSNYIGYEVHTSIDNEYGGMFPYYGTVDFPWFLKTGADFIVWQDPPARYVQEIRDWVDRKVPVLDLGYGIKVARLNDAAGNLPYVPARHPGDFDNGIVRIWNDAGNAVVSGFETDFASRVAFSVQSAAPATVRFQLFPSKRMALYVDGQRTPQTLKDGLLTFTLPPGLHRVEYRYHERLHQLFAALLPLYALLVAGLAAWRGLLAYRSRRARRQPTVAIKGIAP